MYKRAILLVVVMVASMLIPSMSTAKPGGNPDKVCTESGAGWSAKIDTTGDPASVSVTADDGFLIDAYCVSGGHVRAKVVNLSLPVANVDITTGEKYAVSHYQYRQVPEQSEPTCETDPSLCEKPAEVTVNFGVTYGCPPNPYFTPWQSTDERYNSSVTPLEGKARGFYFEFTIKEGVDAVFVETEPVRGSQAAYDVADDGKTAIGTVYTPTLPKCPVPPEDPEDPEKPEKPEKPAKPNKPEQPNEPDSPSTTSQTAVCLAGALVVKVYDFDGSVVSTSTENGHPACAPKDGVVYKEEGF